MNLIADYGRNVVGKLVGLLDFSSPNNYFKSRNDLWIEIISAVGIVVPPGWRGLRQQDYSANLDSMVDITCGKLQFPRPEREFFVFAGISGTSLPNGNFRSQQYIYASGNEYFKVHPLDLMDHNLERPPAILEVRIHQPSRN